MGLVCTGFCPFGLTALLLAVVAMGALFFIFWVIMIVDASTRKFKSGAAERTVWILVIVFTCLVGSLIYYFITYRKDKDKSLGWLWLALLVLVSLFVFALVLSIIFSLFIPVL